MIKKVTRKEAEKANFIVNQLTKQGVYKSNNFISNYPHVEKESIRFVNHCQKSNKKIMGLAQYVPSDVWAMILVDTLKNEYVDNYDENYKYFVNVFNYIDDRNIDLKSTKKSFYDIKEKAESINGSVAISCNGVVWNKIYSIIIDVFADSDLEILIY